MAPWKHKVQAFLGFPGRRQANNAVWRRFLAAPLPPKTSAKYKRKTIFQSSKIAQIITRNSTSSLCLRLIGHYSIQSVLQKGFQIALQERFRPHCKKSSESQALNRLQKSNRRDAALLRLLV